MRGTASTTSRTRAAPRSRSRRTRSPIRTADGLRRQRLGPHRLRRPGRRDRPIDGRTGAHSAPTRRAAPAHDRSARRRHDRADRRRRVASRSRRRSSIPAVARDAPALRRALSTANTASSTPSIPAADFDAAVQAGRVDPALGWFDADYLGIDQGPILAMIENYRSGLVWGTMRKNPYLRPRPAARRVHRRLAGRHGAIMPTLPRPGCAAPALSPGSRPCSSPAAARAPARRTRSDFWAMGREGEVVAELAARVRARRIPASMSTCSSCPGRAAHEKLLTAYAGDATPDVCAARQHLDSRVRGARRASRPARRAASASASIDRRGDYFPGIWDTNVMRRRSSTACPGTSTRACCSTARPARARPAIRCPPRPGPHGGRDARASSSAAAPGNTASSCRSNEFEPIWSPSRCSRLDRCSTTTARAATFESAASARAFDFYVDLFQQRPGAAR